jgi:polyisoprenoid-binding protein YceI
MRWYWKAAIAAVVVLAGLVFAGWWFFLRDDAPPEASLVVRDTPTTVAGAPAQTPDGSWAVQQGDNVFAGYRVTELFAGETIKKTAVGRSPAVTGTMTLAGTQIPAASIEVDLTQLKSDSGRRDSRLQSDGLEIKEFPTASFTLTSPIVLPSAPVLNVPMDVQAAGNLTLHGVTKPVTVALKANWTGDVIDVAGQAPIVLKDFGINPPSVGGFVEVDGDGAFEVQLTFGRA